MANELGEMAAPPIVESTPSKLAENQFLTRKLSSWGLSDEVEQQMTEALTSRQGQTRAAWERAKEAYQTASGSIQELMEKHQADLMAFQGSVSSRTGDTEVQKQLVKAINDLRRTEANLLRKAQNLEMRSGVNTAHLADIQIQTEVPPPTPKTFDQAEKQAQVDRIVEKVFRKAPTASTEDLLLADEVSEALPHVIDYKQQYHQQMVAAMKAGDGENALYCKRMLTTYAHAEKELRRNLTTKARLYKTFTEDEDPHLRLVRDQQEYQQRVREIRGDLWPDITRSLLEETGWYRRLPENIRQELLNQLQAAGNQREVKVFEIATDTQHEITAQDQAVTVADKTLKDLFGGVISKCRTLFGPKTRIAQPARAHMISRREALKKFGLLGGALAASALVPPSVKEVKKYIESLSSLASPEKQLLAPTAKLIPRTATPQPTSPPQEKVPSPTPETAKTITDLSQNSQKANQEAVKPIEQTQIETQREKDLQAAKDRLLNEQETAKQEEVQKLQAQKEAERKQAAESRKEKPEEKEMIDPASLSVYPPPLGEAIAFKLAEKLKPVAISVEGKQYMVKPDRYGRYYLPEELRNRSLPDLAKAYIPFKGNEVYPNKLVNMAMLSDGEKGDGGLNWLIVPAGAKFSYVEAIRLPFGVSYVEGYGLGGATSAGGVCGGSVLAAKLADRAGFQYHGYSHNTPNYHPYLADGPVDVTVDTRGLGYNDPKTGFPAYQIIGDMTFQNTDNFPVVFIINRNWQPSDYAGRPPMAMLSDQTKIYQLDGRLASLKG